MVFAARGGGLGRVACYRFRSRRKSAGPAGRGAV